MIDSSGPGKNGRSTCKALLELSETTHFRGPAPACQSGQTEFKEAAISLPRSVAWKTRRPCDAGAAVQNATRPNDITRTSASGKKLRPTQFPFTTGGKHKHIYRHVANPRATLESRALFRVREHADIG